MAKKLPTIEIKGKKYVMVKDRILAFNELYPNGSITTHILKNDDKSVVVKAIVYPDMKNLERRFIGHSEAYRSDEMMGDVPVEIAETSAVGRAMAMLGIGVIDGVASADEMVKASRPKTLITDKQRKFIETLWQQKGVIPEDPFKALDGMTAWEASKEIERLKKLLTVDSDMGDNNPLTDGDFSSDPEAREDWKEEENQMRETISPKK